MSMILLIWARKPWAFRLDLFRGQFRTGFAPIGGIADQGGVIADDQHGLMAQLLEQPQLAQRNGVAQMNVDAGRIDAVLDAQRLTGLDAVSEFADQFVTRLDLLDAALDQCQLFGNDFHCLLPFPRPALRQSSSSHE